MRMLDGFVVEIFKREYFKLECGRCANLKSQLIHAAAIV